MIKYARCKVYTYSARTVVQPLRYLVINLWNAGVVQEAAVSVHALLVHVAKSIVRRHNSSELTVALKGMGYFFPKHKKADYEA